MDSKTAEERLLHDAVHDNLTGLPNRAALLRPARSGADLREPGRCTCARPCSSSTSTSSSRSMTPSAMPAGDSILLTLPAASAACSSRRIRWRASAATSSRIILLSEREPDRIIAFADMVRRAVTTPITYARARDLPHRLHRHRPPRSADRRAARGGAAERRDRHGPRQAPRRRPHRGLPPDHALATAATISRWKPICAMRSTATR